MATICIVGAGELGGSVAHALARGERASRVVLIDERDYGNPDDGFQMDEMHAIPRSATMIPTMRLTYRDGHTRVARDPHQAK